MKTKLRKVIYLSFFMVVLMGLCKNLTAQVIVNLTQPPPNQLGIADLWKLTLNNPTQNTYRIYLEGTVDEASDGRILEGKSPGFDLPPGLKNITANNIPAANITYKNTKYKEIIIRTGNAPSGRYTFCITVKTENDNQQIGNDCKIQNIEIVSPPVLISPADGDSIKEIQPVFTWLPPAPVKNLNEVTYSIKIVEMLSNQSITEAIDKNVSFFEQQNIKTNMLQYPLNAGQFEINRRYAWDIRASVNNTMIGRSQPSGFIINPGRIPNDTSVFVPPLTYPCDTTTNWDFETGDLCGWRAYGDAFNTQPTYGNNIVSRVPGLRLNENLHYWIGTFENRHDLGSPEGGTQGDELMGALVSKKFVINSGYIHFLMGGGNDMSKLRVELLVKVTREGLEEMRRIGDALLEELRRVDPSIRRGPPAPIKIIDRDTFMVMDKRTGENNERMKRKYFVTNSLMGKTARISVVDSSSADWGHINVDDFRFTDNLPGDIWVTGMEITQSTQTSLNEIPLIGYKKTAVRVYVQSNESGNGPWDNTGAELTVSNISGVHGSSPIAARVYHAVNGSYGLITVSQRDTNRNNLMHSYLFILDIEHTAPGQRKLEFRILPPSTALGTKPEMNPDNDTLSKVIRFAGPLYVSVTGLLFADRFDFPAFTPAAPFSAFEQHRKFTENMFPVSHFYILSYLDNATNPPTFGYLDNSADNVPPTYDRTQTDARQWGGRVAAGVPGGRYYMLQPWNTCGCGTTYGCCFSEGQNNTFFPGGEGEVMAHEIGHQFGRLHYPYLCCDPGYGPWDYSAPIPDGAIGRQFGIKTYDGFEVIPPTHWRRTDSTYDIMAYDDYRGRNVFHWISPYTYCALMNTISGGRITCPGGVERSSINSPDNYNQFTQINNGYNKNTSASGFPGEYKPVDEANYLYISGTLNPDGTAIFYPFESLDFKTDTETESQEKHYKIVYEDKNGKTISEFPFEPKAYDSFGKPHSMLFALTLPFEKNTERIKLLRDNNEIAVRSKSPNAPVLDISPLLNLSELKGRQTLSWSATDADSDPLIYSVDYSTNNGSTWMPLRVLLSQSSTEVDADFLPGTNQGLLRVSVSDGFNTASSRISHVINVSKKNPEITMLPMMQDNDLTPLIAEATAFDCEDGPIIEETSYIWTSDKDGAIATGHWVVLNNLSEGRHILTLTVTDSEGNKSAAATEINVPKKNY